MSQEFYTDQFLEAMLKASRNANLNTKQTFPCCSHQENQCSNQGELPQGFYFNLKSKYDLVVIAIKLYNLLQETKSPLINYIHFVAGLCGDWELLAASLDQTVLTSACEAGQEWRDASVLGNGPINFFQPITSIYGDIVLSFILFLFQDKTTVAFLAAQIQQAYVQIGSECVLNVKYWDSNNFNPRKPFTYSNCNNIWPSSDLPDNLNTILRNTRNRCSFLPQMVWHAFVLDFLRFLDPDYKFTHETRKVMRRGVKYLANRQFYLETCLQLIDRLRTTFKELFGENLDNNEDLHTIIDNPEVKNILKLKPNDLLKIIINLILNWLQINETKISKIPINQLQQKIDSILDNSLTTTQESREILEKATIIIQQVIQGLSNNQLTPELFENICNFYNETCGLQLNNLILRDSPILSQLICD